MANSRWKELYTTEDWWSVWVGALLLIAGVTRFVHKVPKLGKWNVNPFDVFATGDGGSILGPWLLLLLGLGLLTTIAVLFMENKKALPGYIGGYVVVFLLSTLAYVFAHQKQVAASGLGYAFWALLIGLVISNVLGIPGWLAKGARSELFIKIGLVLLGAEILFGKIIALGGPGIFVAWIVTPVVVIFMYLFAIRGLKMKNRELALVIAAATSVCGVSAAIATAAAVRAKKEDLTVAVGITLIFTVLMMILMPMFIQAVGLDLRVGAAWMGGSIDATGAVVAAGAFLGVEAEKIAAIVKMIQNILIGVVAFLAAVYWTTRVERRDTSKRVSPLEIWYRFPKFILGFIAASLVFSFWLVPQLGLGTVEGEIIKPVTAALRGWLFCMAFMSIGLQSNFKALSEQMRGGKPLILYLTGQTFNLVLTLFFAWLAFGGILFELPG